MSRERHHIPGFRDTLLTPGHPKARTTRGKGPQPFHAPLIKLTVERMPSGLHNYDQDLEICPKRAKFIDELLAERAAR